jgi:tubulin-specific chaperone E
MENISSNSSVYNPALNLIKYPKKLLKFEEDKHHHHEFLNRRIEVSDHIGTVKYVGKLKHTNKDDEFWVGVEWDDPSRGKHNGTVEGCQYFSCQHHTGGSLLKFTKVNFGHTFQEAIDFKYNFFNSNNADDLYQFLNKAVESDLYIQANKKRITIELVGKEKAIKKFSQIENIHNVDLAFSYISHIESDLVTKFSRLKELILQKTLFHKWSQFLKIFENFPNLEFLNFSENVLTEYDSEFYEIKNKMIENPPSKCSHIIMNKCKLNFTSLINISFALKNVQTLYLMGNDINEKSYLSDKEFIDNSKSELEKNLSNVTFISLEKNKIKEFLQVYDALVLTNLNRINLNQNHIEKIINNDNDKLILEKFKIKLQGLFLDFNQFTYDEDLTVLKEISKFENLLDLDFLNNKIAQKIGNDNVKPLLIGRLLNLQTLNNTSISKDVRRDSELFYLKSSLNDYVKKFPITSKENFTKEKFEEYMKENHPNYFILKKKYFDPLEDILDGIKTVDMNTMKGNIFEVTFQHSDKKITKKFPKTTSFYNLRNLLSKLFKISRNFSFVINDEETVIDETKTLDNYSVNSSHIIYLK